MFVKEKETKMSTPKHKMNVKEDVIHPSALPPSPSSPTVNSVEAIKKDDVVNQLRSVLSTISASSKDALQSLNGVLNKLDTTGELNGMCKNGISILDVKYQTKLMYLCNVAYLWLRRVHGQRIYDVENGTPDAAVTRLVEYRTVLERIKPLEQKLKYQIDKYVKIGLKKDTDPNDPTRFKANPALMEDVSDREEETDDDNGGGEKKAKKGKDASVASNVYKPPKLSSVHYDGDETRSEKKLRAVERARKRALESNVMQELKEEFLDTPVEYSHVSGGGVTLKNVTSKRDQERLEYEEMYFTRLPLEKRGGGANKLKRMTLNQIGDEVTRFENLSALTGEERRRDGRGTGKGKRKATASGGGKKKGRGGKKRKFK